jgi:hypothetical protein
MQIELFNSFQEAASKASVLFYYRGNISQTVIATMGEALRERLITTDAKGPTSRKLFSSFIEIMQNALQYSHEMPDTPGQRIGSVSVGILDEQFFIVCGNIIENRYQDRISEKLDAIGRMNSDEIRAAYRQQMKSDSSDDDISKGAGLGFLTLARDSSDPFQSEMFDVPGHEGELSWFYLRVVI